jgi:hypothetical protein
MVHEENGWYRCLLNTTDTGTLGILVVAVNETGALPVWREFIVLPANIYDSWVLGTDLQDVSTTQFNGSTVVQSGGRPEVNTTHAAGTAWASGAITAAVIATNAIDADALATDAVTEINTGIATASILAAVDTEVAAIKAKTDNLPTTPASTSDIPTAATIADAVWDEDATAHQTAGTFGNTIGDPDGGGGLNTIYSMVVDVASGSLTVMASLADNSITEYTIAPSGADEIANAVWDVATTGHNTAGSFGLSMTTTELAASNANDTIILIGNGDLPVEANIQSVNGTTVTGSGTGGDPWGP